MPDSGRTSGYADRRSPFRREVISLLLFVSLTGPSAARAQIWRIDPDPVLSIGGLTEDPDYILTTIVGGLRFTDGRVVLADRFTNGLRGLGAWLRTEDRSPSPERAHATL